MKKCVHEGMSQWNPIYKELESNPNFRELGLPSQ